jgi:hypothetical protein
MGQKKKKQPQASEPLLDILATPQSRRTYGRAVVVIFAVGYALSVGGHLRFGATLGQALGRSLVTLAIVVTLQAPVWFWYRSRMKAAAQKGN